jgi:hypothetical protein
MARTMINEVSTMVPQFNGNVGSDYTLTGVMRFDSTFEESPGSIVTP